MEYKLVLEKNEMDIVWNALMGMVVPVREVEPVQALLKKIQIQAQHQTVPVSQPVQME